ncbi:MAG: glycosyltransferase [Marinirhabdus sp.]|nr:glycosyltransferase [Marinirhabdus sp.]
MLSILIPTYNYNVAPLVATLVAEADRISTQIEILILDDASPESIPENEATSSYQQVTYKKLESNKGRTATRHQLALDASFNNILFMDADVFPVYPDFIERYIAAHVSNGVVFGGITYHEEPPNDNEVLRWKYGHAREKQSVAQRKQTPYASLTTGCFLIEKSLFLDISDTIQFKAYGMDLVLKQKFEEQDVPVRHIDNPVYHNGLESNEAFLKKALEAVETTVLLEEKGWLPDNSRALQKHYLKLKKYKALSLFSSFFKPLQKRIERNLLSKDPNLFWFDLYRLNHYISLKRN